MYVCVCLEEIVYRFIVCVLLHELCAINRYNISLRLHKRQEHDSYTTTGITSGEGGGGVRLRLGSRRACIMYESSPSVVQGHARVHTHE